MGRNTNNDNHANQMNPHHAEYWHSRGLDDDEAEMLAEAQRED